MTDLFDVLRPNSVFPGNAGGIASEVYVAQGDDVATFPELDSDGAATISENFVMKSGKFFHKIYGTSETLSPKQEKLEGENPDCGGFRNSLEFFHPGTGEDWQKWLLNFGVNFRGYVIFKDLKENKMYLIGQPGYEATLKSTALEWGGKIDGGKKGSTNTFEAAQERPLIIYKGSLPLEGATIPAAGE